ncbi:L-histidine N(alpha)-methyltransferase [Synechococcus sp. A10-1-5-1]|uniref:L-histidine N(alpha)-methyltransferase n=1 Tax=Synechococcus sp. A10-1-5-1 TaxID=2936507 RepID=UPI0020011EEC|nr:L-histidine N(alpha)-methyltransferase [Synechococcus sp. A10-1-5-1]UPM49328.1 L-histidine N(alpha)-methyltransferase [Synechococcus sp. A10-1-5-1]
MTSTLQRSGVPELLDLHPAAADMQQLVIEGLSQTPKQLPAWFLYDAEGSRLFDLICQQPEYSLTKTETALLQDQAMAMAAALGEGTLVEFGAGSARKVGPLLKAMQQPAYVALDISADHLAQACTRLQADHPGVPMLGICCDYSQLEQLPSHPLLKQQRRHGFFPGSSLGNFTTAAAEALLRQFRRLLGPGGTLLIGIDQPKATERLEAAYDDAAGVSARFALNLLQRLNRDLGSDFDLDQFRYQARWVPEASHIEMALISQREQTVKACGQTWHFAKGEALITETSHKYSPEAFLALASRAGWASEARWSDPRHDLSLHLLKQAD